MTVTATVTKRTSWRARARFGAPLTWGRAGPGRASSGGADGGEDALEQGREPGIVAGLPGLHGQKYWSKILVKKTRSKSVKMAEGVAGLPGFAMT